ncbi:mitochondrial ribosomal protein L37-domain-containing protein [Radiomyces spectabilis]|uniref:mitochondrial ribosomal protein L37-domain-containing protein n=1 Tax=Radiomyces spectabilis TaxID=64574 RepID=UPI0022203E80|nr:mitochondrial ribosomal protein L37-domain-containing protein [Radiomyces spectabilis]KAI8370524.1 mitochondrial ribosomal protein L37-domain-containing protein [Radiomyces spectabilis]
MFSLISRRQVLRPLAKPVQQYTFHHAAIAYNGATAAATEAKPATSSSPARKESSVPKGTVLKGINFLKDGKDPVALDDSEYPDWLWDLLDAKKQKQKSTKPTNRQFHRKQNRDAIKAMNFMKDKKT